MTRKKGAAPARRAPSDPRKDHPQHNGGVPNGLRAALESAVGPLKDLTVLAAQNDSFWLDTDAIGAQPIPDQEQAPL